ncbi:MAG: TldD/PmbA family protein [candidate division Zixibacteria bacterium]|nr:TldD/PmbA family protein [candidate division Zixibacteria bacterium]
MSEYIDLSNDIIKLALKKSADEVEVFIETARESEVSTRMGEVEILKESTSQGLGIRVFKNRRMGFAFTSDFTKNHLEDLAQTAVDLSEQASEDEFNGLPELVIDETIDLDLFDPKLAELEPTWKIDTCKRMEKRMFDYDKRINNSEGAAFYDGDATIFISNSRGLSHSFKSSYSYLYCVPVAVEDGKLQTGHWFSFKRHFDDLDGPEKVAEIAAERVVRMLGATTPKTARVPVVFDPLTAASFVGGILSAVNGDAVFKRATYLVDKLNQQIASEKVTIMDDGRLKKGLASSPVDGEGLPTVNKEIINNGKLATYMYDTYTARKAKTISTANAQRGHSSTPDIGGFNFYMQAGDYSPDDIIGSVKNGLYITNLMGFGADMVTGDYSQGASGLWIENGKLAGPVEGLTVASNMLEMMRNIEMIGNDLTMMGPISSPTFKISEMTVAGS